MLLLLHRFYPAHNFNKTNNFVKIKIELFYTGCYKKLLLTLLQIQILVFIVDFNLESDNK